MGLDSALRFVENQEGRDPSSSQFVDFVLRPSHYAQFNRYPPEGQARTFEDTCSW